MSLDAIFALSSPLRFVGAAVLGLAFGYLFVASTPVHGSAAVRSWAFLGAGIVFTTFDTARRYFEGIPTWQVSIATGVAFATFVGGIYVGLRLRA